MYPNRGAQLLDAALIRLEWTQSQAAEQLGVGQSTLSHWISGRRTPDRDMAQLLAARLGIEIDAWGERPACSTGKKVFDKREAESSRNRRMSRGVAHLRVYVCEVCGWWHLTSGTRAAFGKKRVRK